MTRDALILAALGVLIPLGIGASIGALVVTARALGRILDDATEDPS